MDAPPSRQDLPLLVTADEFARQLSIARRTFDTLVSRGVLPAADVRLSRKIVRWKSSTVRAAVEQLAGGELQHAH